MDYSYAFEKRDISKIDKLNQLNNCVTFWEDVKKLVRGCKSDHALNRWQILAEIRYKELLNQRR